jgi:hypothetical protein
MSKTIDKAALDIILIGVLAKTTKQQCTCLPIAAIRTIDNLRYSISDLLHQIDATAAHEGR